MSMSEITEPFEGSLSAADNRCSEVNTVNRHLPLIPSPPAPASTTATERILLADVPSPPASLSNNSITVAQATDTMKPTHDSNGCVQPESHEDLTLNAADVNFHIVNIPPEEWGPPTTCHNCRQPTRSVKIFTPDEDSVAARSSFAGQQQQQQQQQSEPNSDSHVTDGKGVTILIAQSNTVELNVYTSSGEHEDSGPERRNPQLTNEVAAIGEANIAMVDVTTPEAANVIPGDSKGTSDVPPGSVQFQPGNAVNEEVKATTESCAGASPPL